MDFFILSSLISVLMVIAIFVVLYYKMAFSYWKKRNVPTIDYTIPFGNDHNPINKTIQYSILVSKVYNKLKKEGHKHGGYYIMSKPIYLVIDLEIVKSVLSKDFQYFYERGLYYNEEADPVGAHLFVLGGQKWKTLRTKLTPSFTSGKMKMMFQSLVDIANVMIEYISDSIPENPPIDIRNVMSRYTIDVIGSCAFGLECNSFKNPYSQFHQNCHAVFNASRFQDCINAFCVSFPDLAKSLGLTNIPKKVTKFFYDIVVQTIEYREKNNCSRQDFMQLLIDMKNKSNKAEALTLEEVAAQAFAFFAAGFETSSTTLSFCFLELSKHQDIQEKLSREIQIILKKHNDELTYEALGEMKYMQQFIDEILRKYPPLGAISRECVKDYKVPGIDLIVEKGMMIFVPVYAIHHDPEYYPDPEKFDPERFSEENKNKIPQFAYTPFGEGPRLCIGMRFGLVQVKVALTMLLKNFKFTLNERTRYPVEFDPYSFTLSPKDIIYVNAIWTGAGESSNGYVSQEL